MLGVNRGPAHPGTPSYTPDLTAAIPGTTAAAPNPMESRNYTSRRKQTLLTLLDALNELNKDDDLLETSQQQLGGNDEAPALDEHLQVVGAEAFGRFQRKIESLDKELRNFANASRQLGSSVRLLSSAYHLRERLTQILFLFRENAADLFPRKVLRQPKESLFIRNNVNHKNLGPSKESSPDTPTIPHSGSQRKKWAKPAKTPTHVARPTVLDSLDAEDFPLQLSELAADLDTFLDCLNEFPEFTDEAVNAVILSLEGDLKYWASCLKTYEGQFKYPAVQRYLHDLMSEMGEHIDSITSTLSMFIEIGVPTIRFAQKHGATNLLNLSTVATFFSAVTATTLQFSYQSTSGTISDGVNAFWFSSMVFSVAAAVNSLLGLTWKQAMYRSPGHRVPWWVSIWMKRSPLVFLCISVASFSIGLVLFAYSSQQSLVTKTLTTIFTAFSSFGLIAVSLWFMFERWTYYRHRGKKWLADVLSESAHELRRIPGVDWVIQEPKRQVRHAADWAGGGLKRVTTTMRLMLLRPTPGDEEKDRASDVEEGAGMVQNSGPGRPSRSEPTSPLSSPSAEGHMMMGMRAFSRSRGQSLDALSDSADTRTETGTLATPVIGNSASGVLAPANTPATEHSPARSRWTAAVKSVMMMRASSSANGPFGLAMGAFSPRRQRTMSSSGVDGTAPRVKAETGDVVGAWRTTRIAALVPQLKSLEATHEVPAHVALVKHMQFSPSGRFLATSSWDRTSMIFKVGEWSQPHRILAHPQGFVGQVAWSPGGNLLLTKLGRGVKVWTEDGVCRKTIDRHRNIQSIAWCPGGEAFMSVENSEVVKLDLNGSVLGRYKFDRMMLHDVAVTPDSQRMLGVATLLESGDGLQPSRSRAEKQIVIYNLEKAELENQVPVLQEVRDITLARNGLVALVSYENKAPPQLWRLELVKDHQHQHNDGPIARLALRHIYMPKFPIDFAGPSYFGGQDDQLVLCAGKAGDIHIWDRETGLLLHHFRAQTVGGDLTCLAWNHAADPFMFSTGSHEGIIRIWTTPRIRGHPPPLDLGPAGDTTTRILAVNPDQLAQLPDGFRRSDGPSHLTRRFSLGTGSYILDEMSYRSESPVDDAAFMEAEDMTTPTRGEMMGASSSVPPLPLDKRAVAFEDLQEVREDSGAESSDDGNYNQR